MIRAIAAVDSSLGIVPTEKSSPWHLRADKDYFIQKTTGQAVLMGFNTYRHDLGKKPLPGRRNFVVVRPGTDLMPGFEVVYEPVAFLQNYPDDIWVIGGASLFVATLDVVKELYLTELAGNYHFSNSFPVFRSKFELIEKGDPVTEKGITFCFNVYRRKV